MTVFKSLIRSVFDYCFIIANVSTQKITKHIQIAQNKILRTIKYFPLKTKTDAIHRNLNIEFAEKRTSDLFINYINKSLLHNELLAQEFERFRAANENETEKRRFKTPFDAFIEKSTKTLLIQRPAII